MVEVICGVLCVVFAMLCVALLGLCIFLAVLTRKVYAAHVTTQAWAVNVINTKHKFYHNLMEQKDEAHQQNMLMLTSHLTFTVSALKSQNKDLMEWVVVFLHDEQKRRNPDSPSVNVVPMEKSKKKEDEEEHGGPTLGG